MKKIVILILAIVGIVLIYRGLSGQHTDGNQNQVEPDTQKEGFILPESGIFSLGQELPILIKTSPTQEYCGNGFYLHDNDGTTIGPVGIMTEPGKTSYTWPDTSERYDTCGTGVGEIPIPVSPGSYKICLHEINIETGDDQTLYCSDGFSLE